MEHLPIHVCSRCRHLQSHTTRQQAVVVCENCGDRDTAPIAAQFGQQEWEARDFGDRMLACLPLLGIDLTPRKMRLIACAAARAQFSTTDTTYLRHAVALAEEWVDTGTSPKGSVVARRALEALARSQRPAPLWAILGMRCLADDGEVGVLPFPVSELLPPLCREQFGNPFVAPDWQPDWFTTTVRDLASHIYNSREFGAMPILADALQDAGCDVEQILTHCRADKPHARGCWVLDAILGKA